MRWTLLAALATAVVTSAVGLQAAPSIEAYGKLPSLDLVRLSPSGERIAFVAVDGDTRKLFIRKVGGDAVLVDTVGKSKIRDIEWAGENFAILTVSYSVASYGGRFNDGLLDKWSRSPKQEIPLVLVVDIAKGSVTPIFAHARADMYLGEALPLGARLIDGRWYEFVFTYHMGLGALIYRVDLQTGAYSEMGGYQGTIYGYLIDADGAILARDRYDEDTHLWNLFAGGAGNRIVAQRKSDLDLIDLNGLGRAPGRAIVVETADDKDTITEYSMAGGGAGTRLLDGLSVDRFVRDPVSHLLVGAELSRGGGLVAFDPVVQRRLEAVRKAFPGLQVHLESLSAGFGRLVVRTDGGDDSGTYWLIDMTTGHAQDLMSAYPSIDPKDVAPTRVFAYHAADGMALEGVLTLPPGAAANNLPLVVIPHGGPIGVYDWLGFDYWAQAFASRGYAVVSTRLSRLRRLRRGLPPGGLRPVGPQDALGHERRRRGPRGCEDGRSQASVHRRGQLWRLCGARQRDGAPRALPLRRIRLGGHRRRRGDVR
jgi:dipeptidyl aminopeptidase/acylaminoacyl peptidase